MTVGEVIREKRKELGLTQEQVARRLGVSAPAVNKWEKSGTYPDITILPALARLLNTDINTLLCNEIAKTMETDGMEAAVDTAEKMVREYPNCGKLIHMMASMVQGLLVMSGGRDREKYEGKICSWILLSGKGIWSGRRRSHLRESGLLSYMISGDTAP